MRTLLLALAIPVFAQPHLENARVETRAARTLDAAFHAIANAAAAPAWIGYALPRAPGPDEDGSCKAWLEPGRANPVPPSSTAHLEGATEFYVFLRIENAQVNRIRTFSLDCSIDAGGLTVYWLTGVNPAQSVALLDSFAGAAERRVSNGAIAAIALTRDNSADSALDRLAEASQPEQTRRQAMFWMGVARGRHGYESLVKILANDPSDRVREHAVFALSRSQDSGAIPQIVRAAREDPSARVRGQALFWLAQTAQQRFSEEAIRRAIKQDPETEVKKKAVFALTQMRNGGGVPILIEVARNNANPAVRKQAMFWLAQSKDPRAVKFFEEVLSRP
ncbi:MAG TPA: HEAT repeat domain-containing protein [Bryobacteraceae bacterium]|jgi:hypothetical protein|nr:HEAT repeat domain-containing protein [Bryobacteraceae bacterium]